MIEVLAVLAVDFLIPRELVDATGDKAETAGQTPLVSLMRLVRMALSEPSSHLVVV